MLTPATAQSLAKGNSPTQRAWKRFRRSKLALVGLVVVAIMTILAVAAPIVAQQDPLKNDLLNRSKPPTAEHIFGTDRTGRDIFSRTIYGGRISLLVGLVAVTLSVSIGTVLGLVSGFYGGLIDNIVMRLTDVIMAFPPIIIIMAAVPIVANLLPSEATIYGIMAVIGLLTWPQLARLIRGQTLVLRNAEYVVASESLGASKGRQMFVHILPQTLASLLVFATFGIANAILLEAGLSFLGQGVQPPTPSWGNMVESARSLDILENLPWTWFAPGIFIVVTVVSINFIGDALRDAVDPKSR